jgi:hypothetical protein
MKINFRDQTITTLLRFWQGISSLLLNSHFHYYLFSFKYRKNYPIQNKVLIDIQLY